MIKYTVLGGPSDLTNLCNDLIDLDGCSLVNPGKEIKFTVSKVKSDLKPTGMLKN